MITKVSKIVRNNRRLTLREIADDCRISVGSCGAILTDDLHMKRVCAKFVTRLLTDDQREQRQTIARDLFVRSCEVEQFLKNIVTLTSPWSTGMTWTQNSNRYSGRVPRLRGQRKGARCEAKQRSC